MKGENTEKLQRKNALYEFFTKGFLRLLAGYHYTHTHTHTQHCSEQQCY